MSRETESPTALRDSPWGRVIATKPKGEGLIFVTTNSHGGLWLDRARRAQMAEAFPAFKPWGGRGLEWLEEDCDINVAAILWPADFSPAIVSAAVAMISEPMLGYFADVRPWLESPAGADARRIAAEFSASVSDLWEVGGMVAGVHKTPGWRVLFTHRTTKEQKWLVLPDYPAKSLYSPAELEQFGPENKTDEKPPSRPLGEGTVFPVPAYEQIHRRPACQT